MPDPTPQTYANHRKIVPLYHIVTSLLLLVNAGYAIWMTVTRFSFSSLVYLGTAVALVLMFWYLRVFATGVQDRVIRVEERLRFQKILPESLKPRINELTTGQCVGLRFASDAELPSLAQRVLDENIQDKEAIKKLIKEWRPDDARI
jgi:hypothetical protein